MVFHISLYNLTIFYFKWPLTAVRIANDNTYIRSPVFFASLRGTWVLVEKYDCYLYSMITKAVDLYVFVMQNRNIVQRGKYD